MIIEQKRDEVIRSGSLAEQSFTIKASATSFDILSSGLYSDKILAVIRELSCNAYDAHVMAGKQHIPIEIKLPTSLDQTFYVKDFGIGLSEDQVFSLYTTYFESTKQDSNDVIGALGLGSKSPFSYTDNFLVESRFNGIKSVFVCFKNELGIPSVSKLNSIETDEENGLTIQISIDTSDFDAFYYATTKAIYYFDVKPNVLGSRDVTPTPHDLLISGSNWKLYRKTTSIVRNGAYIIQGMVAYPISESALSKTTSLPHKISYLLKLQLDIFVDIGDVEVAASREALSYTPNTITKIIQLLEATHADVLREFNNYFGKIDTYWNAVKEKQQIELTSYTMDSFLKASDILYNGRKITKKIAVRNEYVKVYRIRNYRLSWVRQEYMTTHVDPVSNVRVIINDLPRISRSIITHASTNNSMIYVIEAQLLTEKDLNSLLEEFGNPPTKLASKIKETMPKTETTAYKKRPTHRKLMWLGFETRSQVFKRSCWTEVDINMDDGGFFVPTHRSEIHLDAKPILYFDDVLTAARSLGIIKSDDRIYGFSKPEIKQIDSDPDSNWINLFDYIKASFDIKNKNDVLVGHMVTNQVFDMLPSSFKCLVKAHSHMINKRAPDNNFKRTVLKFDQLYKSTISDELNLGIAVSVLVRLYKLKVDTESVKTQLLKVVKDLFAEYKVLHLLESYPTEETVKILIGCIEDIDSSKKKSILELDNYVAVDKLSFVV